MTSHRDAQKLPQELADELAALDLPTYEQRRDAINGAPGTAGIRARFLSQLDHLRRAHSHGDLLCVRVATDLNRLCDGYIIEALPPTGSGLYASIPRSF